MGRKPCSSKDGLHKGSWNAHEDKLLISYINASGEGKWASVPKRAGLKRCGKSCRLRWLNYLRPNLKRGNFSEQEEDLIIRLHKLLGNRWALIAGRLPGRTDNEIKNYWNTTLSKKAHNQTFHNIINAWKASQNPQCVSNNESPSPSPCPQNKNETTLIRTKALRYTRACYDPSSSLSPQKSFFVAETQQQRLGDVLVQNNTNSKLSGLDSLSFDDDENAFDKLDFEGWMLQEDDGDGENVDSLCWS